MMKINRENYEIWFIDFIDGKLDDEARKELNEFLDDNPDLREELDDFEELRLVPSAILCDDTEKLYKGESDVMEIPHPDYLLIKQMEEGLTDEEEKELAAIIRKEESFIKRGVEFQHSRLTPEPIPYQRKLSLLQKRILPVWLSGSRIAAAAVAAVLLFTLWDSSLFFSPVQNELALQPMLSRPANIIVPEIPQTNLAQVRFFDKPFNLSPRQSTDNIQLTEVLDNNVFVPYTALQEDRMEKLRPNPVKLSVAGRLPNAYEAGLRHMMPMYLDINRNNDRLLALLQSKSAKPEEETFFLKGLQFVDRVSGDLVNFDKLYDEEGNFIAYNFKAGYFEVERKLRR